MSEFPGLSQEWIDDCRRWRGMVLNGRFAHWCADWDDLPVDEITPEWPSCTCFRDDPPVQMAFHFNHFRYTVFYYIHNPAQPEVF